MIKVFAMRKWPAGGLQIFVNHVRNSGNGSWTSSYLEIYVSGVSAEQVDSLIRAVLKSPVWWWFVDVYRGTTGGPYGKLSYFTMILLKFIIYIYIYVCTQK